MAIFRGLKGWFGGNATNNESGEQFATPSQYDTESAKSISEDTALQVSAVWACARLLSETVASLPIKVYEVDGYERIERPDHRLAKLLNSPNAHMTSQEYRETQMLNLCFHGNAYAEKVAVAGVQSLIPMPAQQVTPILKNGDIVYRYETDSETRELTRSQVHHTKLFGNGYIGLSPLAYARNTIGLASAAEEYGHNFYLKGGSHSGVLSTEQKLTPEQAQQISELMASGVLGGKRGGLMVMGHGFKFQQVTMNPDDLQMIQTRRFQLEDICRFFGVPSFLVNDTEKTTTWGSGIEQMMIGFYQLNLRPYLTRWEESIQKNLMTAQERNRFVVEFDFASLLRGDSAGRANYYSQMVQNGLMTRNEARIKENLPPVEGGDELTAQVNLMPLSKLGSEDSDNEELV